jgi:hypothetical protein
VKLREYAQTQPIPQDQAQAVFDSIQLTEVSLSEKATVLNMLNTKYIVLNPGQRAIKNTNANGNAWFVGSVKNAKNANEEMSSIYGLNSKTTAVVNTNEFSETGISSFKGSQDSTSSIRLTNYGTKVLKYTSTSSQVLPAIFSEIYYPKGWNCYIDGKLTPSFRANYILRGVMVPAGKHTIEWRFEPKSFETASVLGAIGSFSLLAGCALIFGMALKMPKQEASL